MRPLPSLRARVAVVSTVFTVVGALALAVGLIDAVAAQRMQYQLLGITFALAGLTLLAASTVLTRPSWRERIGSLLSVLAGLAGAFVGGYLTVAQFRAPQGPDPTRISLWLLIALTCVGSGVVAWRATHGSSANEMQLGPLAKGLVTTVGAVGLLLGGVQWWYTNQYLPGSVGATLSVTTELEERVRPTYTVPESTAEPEPHTHPRVFDARVTISNQSRTTVQVVASIQHVYRLPMTALVPADGDGFVEAAQNSACFFERLAPVQQPDCPHSRVYDQVYEDDVTAQDDWHVSRYAVQPDNAEVLHVGKAVPDGTYFEPEEEYAYSFPVYVPNSVPTYDDELRLEVHVVVAKGQRLVLEVNDESHGPEQVQAAVESAYERKDNERPGGRQPRSYPHRYEVTEWRVRPLSKIARLTTGPQAVDVIRVLSGRNAGMVVESPYLITCFSEAGRFEETRASDRIRRDPTIVCPGVWHLPRNQYDRALAEFYGMVGTVSTALVSLMPSEGQPAGAAQSEVPSTVSYLPERSFVEACAPVFAAADRSLTHGDEVSEAVWRHARVMSKLDAGNLTADQAMEQGQPSLLAGERARSLLIDEVQDFLRRTGPCDGESVEAWDPRNIPCTERFTRADQALDHARAMADALNEHARAMYDLRDGRGSRQDAVQRGEESLATGVSQSGAFVEARSRYDRSAAWCR